MNRVAVVGEHRESAMFVLATRQRRQSRRAGTGKERYESQNAG